MSSTGLRFKNVMAFIYLEKRCFHVILYAQNIHFHIGHKHMFHMKTYVATFPVFLICLLSFDSNDNLLDSCILHKQPFVKACMKEEQYLLSKWFEA